jgi:hypothetical protein
MSDIPLIKEKEIEINGQKFIISKLPATVGRELVAKYPASMIPGIGNYEVSEEAMLTMMSFVQKVKTDGTTIRLTNKALVDNHVEDWETLIQLERAMIEYNCSFFQNGKGMDFLKQLMSLAEQKLTETLTTLSAKSSQTAAQPSTSSKQSTR